MHHDSYPPAAAIDSRNKASNKASNHTVLSVSAADKTADQKYSEKEEPDSQLEF